MLNFHICFCLQGDKGDKGDKGEKGDKGDTGDRGKKIQAKFKLILVPRPCLHRCRIPCLLQCKMCYIILKAWDGPAIYDFYAQCYLFLFTMLDLKDHVGLALVASLLGTSVLGGT